MNRKHRQFYMYITFCTWPVKNDSVMPNLLGSFTADHYPFFADVSMVVEYVFWYEGVAVIERCTVKLKDIKSYEIKLILLQVAFRINQIVHHHLDTCHCCWPYIFRVILNDSNINQMFQNHSRPAAWWRGGSEKGKEEKRLPSKARQTREDKQYEVKQGQKFISISTSVTVQQLQWFCQRSAGCNKVIKMTWGFII